MKRFSLIIFSMIAALSTGVCASEIIVRKNNLGYFPGYTKTVVVSSNEDLEGRSWKLTGEDGDVVVESTVAESVHGKGGHSVYNYNHSIDFSEISEPGEYTLSLPEDDIRVAVSISDDPYSTAVGSILRWMKVQRSGTVKTLDRGPSHFGDSACYVYRQEDPDNTSDWDNWVEDENSKRVDLKGGWYTVGNDYRKFTNLTAYTTYYLLKAYQTNPELFDTASGHMGDIRAEARHGLEYLLKVMPDDEEFIIQVGGFDYRGTRLPENDRYDGQRKAYSAISPPDMAWVSAALALGSSVFADAGDDEFAETCKEEAVKIYNRALEDDAQHAWIERDYALFKDDSPGDNFLIASMELYNLTEEMEYLSAAKSYSDDIGSGYWAAWYMQHMMGQSLIVDEHEAAQEYWDTDISYFAGQAESNIWGFPMEYGPEHLYSAKQIASSALRYKQRMDDDSYIPVAVDVINYIYGLNNWGVNFVALEEYENSVKNIHATVYRLQTTLYPEGIPVYGPTSKQAHKDGSVWILDDLSTNYCHPFNTESVVFYDHSDDYMTTNAGLTGAADSIYLLTLALTLLGQ